MKILSYKDLAKDLFKKLNGEQYNENKHQHKEIMESIIPEFYNIQNELLKHLNINSKLYKIEDRIEIIKMIYEFKHLYYSKREIINFLNNRMANEEEYTNIINLFHEFNKGSLNMKQYNNLKICERILKEERNFKKALNLIEDRIDNDENTIIKRIAGYDVSQDLLEDLKRYYFKHDICEKYIEEISIMTGLNLGMAVMYSDFLSGLRYRLMEENLSKEHKDYIYNNLTGILTKSKKQLDTLIRSNENDEYDLLILFYIRISRLEIARTLEHQKKLLKLLKKQCGLLKLNKYNSEFGDENEKIPNIWRSVLIDEENLTNSNKRILQAESKDIVPIIKHRYKGKFKLLGNNNVKIKKLILRELYIDKKSKGIKNRKLREIKEDCNLYEFKLSEIIEKMKSNKELTNEEGIFIDTVINRGINLEMGNISDSINVDNIDVFISEVIIKIYSLNDITIMNYYVSDLFNILKCVLNQKFKNEKK